MAIKCRLRELLKEQQMTQRELAENTGLTESMISYIAAGKRDCTIRSVEKIMRVLNCSFTDLWEV